MSVYLSNINGNLISKAKIYNYLKNPMNKIYHLFILSVYWKLYLVNLKRLFVKPAIPKYLDMIRLLYIEMLKMYMKQNYVESHVKSKTIYEINPNDEDNWESLNCMQSSDEVYHLLSVHTLSTEKKEDFQTNWGNFLTVFVY